MIEECSAVIVLNLPTPSNTLCETSSKITLWGAYLETKHGTRKLISLRFFRKTTAQVISGTDDLSAIFT
jgi:hypothetical protein